MGGALFMSNAQRHEGEILNRHKGKFNISYSIYSIYRQSNSIRRTQDVRHTMRRASFVFDFSKPPHTELCIH